SLGIHTRFEQLYQSSATPDLDNGNLHLSHGGLAGAFQYVLRPSLSKDDVHFYSSDADRDLFNKAKDLATQQVRHEFARLISLLSQRYGTGIFAVLRNSWTDNAASQRLFDQVIAGALSATLGDTGDIIPVNLSSVATPPNNSYFALDRDNP